MSFSVVNDSLSNSDVNLLSSSSTVSLDRIDTVNKTASFTVGSHDIYIVAGAAANVSVTLPDASSCPGRVLHLKNQSGTYTVISASSNVVPPGGGAAGTAILAAVNGNSATLLSNGVNWYNVRATTM